MKCNSLMQQTCRPSGTLGGGSPVSHVDFKKWQCPLSLFLQCQCQFLINTNVACRTVHVMLVSPISHVGCQNCPCCPAEFKGQGSLYCQSFSKVGVQTMPLFERNNNIHVHFYNKQPSGYKYEDFAQKGV